MIDHQHQTVEGEKERQLHCVSCFSFWREEENSENDLNVNGK